ncbi:hypothetical protein [Microbacterium oleivorans]|uniref:hypothetical protein n=1 Tax=Microbacterium oleivorans TaxID=273677 RepID=UPI0007675199|nr:hypothetical protein [Microbacterium oleivorans]AZS44431.1 hypothetical protein BWL13_02020 [Microbacterium oleivorans]THE06084.1 hypothetical protein E1I21_13715 [Microbacterium oleivorans]
MTNYAQRNEAVQRKQMGSGAFIAIFISIVFLVVAAGFVILGMLFLTIPKPVIVLGIVMLLGAVVLLVVAVSCIVASVRALMRPAQAKARVERLA